MEEEKTLTEKPKTGRIRRLPELPIPNWNISRLSPNARLKFAKHMEIATSTKSARRASCSLRASGPNVGLEMSRPLRWAGLIG